MADQIKLEFETRTVVGKKVNRLRRAGILPATVYGKGVGPFTVQISARGFNEVYRRAGKTSKHGVTAKCTLDYELYGRGDSRRIHYQENQAAADVENGHERHQEFADFRYRLDSTQDHESCEYCH